MRIPRLGSNLLGPVIGTRDDELVNSEPGALKINPFGPVSVNNGNPYTVEFGVFQCIPNPQTGASFTVRVAISGSFTSLTASTTNLNGWSESGWANDGNERVNTYTISTVESGWLTSSGEMPEISVTPTGTFSVSVTTNGFGLGLDPGPSSDQTASDPANGATTTTTINPA